MKVKICKFLIIFNLIFVNYCVGGEKNENEIVKLNSALNYDEKFGDILLNLTATAAKINANRSNRATNTPIAKRIESLRDSILTENVHENEYLLNLSKRLLEYSSVFDASKSPLASDLCKRHTKLLKDGISNFHLWALKMHDSTGKLPAGILSGNINQFGDFDQCIGVSQIFETADDSDDVQGQYCLAYLQPRLTNTSVKFGEILKLVQSHGAFKSDFDDAGHRVPRFSLINWGICVPASCTAGDIEYTLKNYIKEKFDQSGIEFNIRVEPNMCHVKTSSLGNFSNKIVIGFFAAILIITILSTIYDSSESATKNKWYTAFSLIKNGKWLFSTSQPADDIQAVHGIRFLNAVMLLLSHKSMAIFFNPYGNRTILTESLGKPWTVIGRAASLYTDPFLLFSGMLTAYSLFGKLLNNRQVNIKMEYMNRIFRILPPLSALILFCTFVLPLSGSGPQWNLVVEHNANLCKQSWWRNLLFIHNYFGFGDMCLTHTHHLGIDTQLFFCAPLMILLLWKWPKRGLVILTSLAGLATFCRYNTSIQNELSNYVYFGTTIKRLFKTADFMYSFPPYRSTVYIMGIILGYALRKCTNYKFTNAQLKLGWTVTFITFVITIFGPAPMGDISYKYNSFHAAIYAAFAPVLWCSIFSWIVFVTHMGFENKLTKLLSWKGFQITTKLSYAIYLTQFPIFFYNVGRTRHINYYYNFVSTMLDVNEYFCVVFFSIVLTLLFDAPFQNIKKIIFDKQLQIQKNKKES